ncbi:MAG: HAD family hydrolase [Deltaproteobacteria bacterium]|nr:HAD family hydrolase [Deltaproteobacteria bacterium]
MHGKKILYLFDIDGTLLHAHRAGRDAFDAVFEARHGIAGASEGVRYGGKTDPAIVEEIFVARLGRRPDADERAAFLDAYLPLLRTRLAVTGVDVLPGVRETLAYLREREVPLGIATGNIRRGADEKLAAAELGAWFELGGYGCDSAIRAELVARAIERARERHDVMEVVVVGDTTHDIAAARACKATVCAVATGSDARDLLAGADAVFDAMTELPAWHAARFA